MAPGLLAVLLLALGCALGRVSPLDIRREAVCVCVCVCAFVYQDISTDYSAGWTARPCKRRNSAQG